jgi:hypothetical protein
MKYCSAEVKMTMKTCVEHNTVYVVNFTITSAGEGVFEKRHETSGGVGGISADVNCWKIKRKEKER